MDCQDYITESAERKKRRRRQREERGAVRHLKRQGYANRAIDRQIGCSLSTAANELRRGGGRLQGQTGAFPQMPSDLPLRPLPSLGDKAVQRAQVVSGRLRRLCPPAQAVPGGRDGMHAHPV